MRCHGLVHGVTNSELMFDWGADMDNNPGLYGLTLEELKERCHRPIGVYLGCPKEELKD